jgi:hypothetical protein
MTIKYKDSKRIVGLSQLAITHDTTSSTESSGSVSSLTHNMTVADNSNRVLIACVSSYGGSAPTITGVTWNGDSMTAVPNSESYQSGSNNRTQLYYIIAPDTGSHSIVASFSGSATCGIGGMSFYNVHQTTPVGAGNTSSATSTATSSLALTPTVTGSWIIAMISSSSSLGSATGLTQSYTEGTNALLRGGRNESPTIGSANTVGWGTSNGSHAMSGCAIIPYGDEKPTDVQDNSLLIEKDTARRYWFSKPTTFEQNFDSNTGHTSNQTTVNGWYAEDYTKIAYDGTNHYLKYAAMGSTNWGASFDLQQSGNNGVGSAINSSKWTLRFKWHILTNSGSTSNGSQGAFGISSVPATTLNSQDFMGFSMRQHANGGEVGLFNATLDNNNPMNQGTSAKKFVTGNLTAGTTYYAEIIRDGDKCTTTLRTGSHTGTQVGSMERTVTGISGLRYLYYKAQQDSGSATHTSYIDDIDFINGADTWTREGALDKTGLKAYWRFNETSGNIINQAEAIGSTDSADNTTGAGGSDLTTSGTTYNVSKSPMNYSLQFDGSNDYAKAGTSTSAWNFMHSTTAKWTVCFWADMTGNGSGTIMGNAATNNTNNGIQIICTNANGTFRARVTDGGGVVTQLITSSGFVPQDNAMHFYKITYDQSLSSDNMKMSVDNGTNVTQTKAANAPTDGNAYQAMYIGMSTTSDFPCAGEFAEMSIWNRVLTDAEVTAIYNSGSGVFPLF